MKNSIAICVLLLAALPVLATDAADPARAVEAAVEAFGEAFAVADVEALDALLATDYVHVNGGSGSLVSRSDWLAWIASRQTDLASGGLVIETYEVQDLRIDLHGSAAVVTGVVTSNGIERGERFASRLRFTNLWVHEDGAWRRAAFHDSPLPDR